MQLYSAKVRLAGSLLNEVLKEELTAPEVTVLRAIHGPESIVDLKAGKQVDRSDSEERARLEQMYAPALATIKNVQTLTALIGPEGTSLAKTIPGVDSLPPPKAGRPKKPDPEPEPDPEPVDPAAVQFT